MTRKTVLLIDDDETLLELLGDYVRTSGYQCLVSSNGKNGIRRVADEHPDLVVLDVMMPGMDGWEVCERLRDGSKVPIIMLTAKGEEIDKLRGFRLGIDDYVTKPFSFAELVARIGAVLGRSQDSFRNRKQVVTGDLVIDFDKHQITVSGKSIDLTPTEFRLLQSLAQRLNHTISTEQLLDEVWGAEYEGQIDQVKHYIWSLRQKIEHDPGDPKHIITERGFGYRLE